MQRLVRFVLPSVLALGLAGWALPAGAGHNADVHSANMSNLFNSGPTSAVNSDIAFWGNRAYYGNYNGFRIYDISNPASPSLLRNFSCFGPQNDPVVWKNKLLFLAIDRTLSGPECGNEAVAHDDPNGWEGVRIFDVSNPASPTFIKGVYTDCGAHTITMYPKNSAQILLYVSSYPLRPGPTCGTVNGPAAGRDPVHGVIQVIKVPVNNPKAAKEIAEPPINYPGDSDNQFVASQHGLPGPPVLEPALRACHDIAVFVELKLAAAACAEQAQLWSIAPTGIPNTANPLWVYDDSTDSNGATQDPADPEVAVDFWHSATFSQDGSVVNFIDESFADPGVDSCPPVTTITDPDSGNPGPSDTGRMFFLDTATGTLHSTFMIPRTEGAGPCYNSAHLGNTVATADADLLVNAWYMGGVDVIDFSDPTSPTEVAHYDIAPAGATGSDNWSAYWYEGPTALGSDTLTIYATDGVHSPSTGRGAQVFKVTGLGVGEANLGHLNPQTQG